MKIENPFEPRGPRSYVVFDLESAVLDHTAHRRYQAMERWVPDENRDCPSRPNYTRGEDPCKTPRWPFQTITTASILIAREHPEGGIDVSRFATYSAPDNDERAVLIGILQELADAPANADLCSWGGAMHDVPLLVAGCARHGLTLPANWKWLAFGGRNAARHVDLLRVFTGGFAMKPVHQTEMLAAMELPGKWAAKPAAVAKLIEAGQWQMVKEACEGDCVSEVLMLARWRQLMDGRADVHVVEDRILRRIIELMPERGYVAALQARREARFAAQYDRAANDAAVLAPWLDREAAQYRAVGGFDATDRLRCHSGDILAFDSLRTAHMRCCLTAACSLAHTAGAPLWGYKTRFPSVWMAKKLPPVLCVCVFQTGRVLTS